MVLKASLIALAGFNTCEKIIMKAINSDAEISEDLLYHWSHFRKIVLAYKAFTIEKQKNDVVRAGSL